MLFDNLDFKLSLSVQDKGDEQSMITLSIQVSRNRYILNKKTSRKLFDKNCVSLKFVEDIK